MTTGLPFDDYRNLLKSMPGPDERARERAAGRNQQLSAQGPALGRLGRVAEWLAAWTGRDPQVLRPLVALFAGTHGLAKSGVQQTQAMVEHAAAGGAAVNQICAAHDLGLKIFDLALHLPVGNIAVEPALDERGCAATMAFGMEAVAGGLDLVALGRFGRGGDTAAAALAALLHPERADEVLAAAPEGERAILAPAIERHNSAGRDPFELLRRVGTRDMAAIVGAILAARTERVPVLLDGAPAIAAAAVLHAASPDNVAHCRIATVSSLLERILADILGLAPLVDFPGETAPGGEGVGALIAFPLMQSASDILETAVSREQAGLSAA